MYWASGLIWANLIFYAKKISISNSQKGRSGQTWIRFDTPTSIWVAKMGGYRVISFALGSICFTNMRFCRWNPSIFGTVNVQSSNQKHWGMQISPFSFNSLFVSVKPPFYEKKLVRKQICSHVRYPRQRNSEVLGLK